MVAVQTTPHNGHAGETLDERVVEGDGIAVDRVPVEIDGVPGRVRRRTFEEGKGVLQGPGGGRAVEPIRQPPHPRGLLERLAVWEDHRGCSPHGRVYHGPAPDAPPSRALTRSHTHTHTHTHTEDRREWPQVRAQHGLTGNLGTSV